MREDEKIKVKYIFRVAVVTGIIIFVVLNVTLVIIGLPVATAFIVAYTMALSVFGAFLYKIYCITTRELQIIDNHPPQQPLDKPAPQRCLILAARTHGALQDRANYWLSGKYGIVKSSAVTATDKGIYMTIFYEPNGSLDLPDIKDKQHHYRTSINEGEQHESDNTVVVSS